MASPTVRTRGIALVFSWVLACAPRPTDAPPDETSVRPGINDPYFDDALDKSVAQLERHERDVFAHRLEIVARLPLRPGMRVADVGAGTGVFVPLLAERVGTEGRVVAIDIVPAFLERLAAMKETIANLEVQEATTRDSGLEEASVDLLFLCDVYHHLEYPRTFMSSLARALAPGGKLVVIDFDRIEGRTSPRMMRHVRAGKDVVLDELAAVGFVLVEEVEMLDENYFVILEFRGSR
jgi:ubiquinone/menaquinone biosynthesis C-methylase UbiE